MTATAVPSPRLVHGEVLQWHAGRLWVCDWERREIVTPDPGGGRRVIAMVPPVPFTGRVPRRPVRGSRPPAPGHRRRPVIRRPIGRGSPG